MNEYPLNLQHGEITRVWRNPNLFVTDDGVPDEEPGEEGPTYDPVDMSKLDDNIPYYFVADTEFTGTRLSRPQIRFYWCNPSGGITPDKLQVLGDATRQTMTPGIKQLITDMPSAIPQSGHLCLIAWIVKDTLDRSTVYPDTIPTKPNGTIDASHPLVAQRNVTVIDIPNDEESVMFEFSVPAGINEIQIKRSPIAENRDLLEESGMGNLTNEAEEAPRMEIFQEGRGLPVDVFNSEAVSKSPVIDMTKYNDVKLTVRAELPKVNTPDTGAIYSFETIDEQDGVAMIVAYKQTEPTEKVERGTEEWFQRYEKLFGKRKAAMGRKRWKRRRNRRH